MAGNVDADGNDLALACRRAAMTSAEREATDGNIRRFGSWARRSLIRMKRAVGRKKDLPGIALLNDRPRFEIKPA